MKKLSLFLIIALSACSASGNKTVTVGNGGGTGADSTPPITLPTSFVKNVLSTQSTFNPDVQIIIFQLQVYSKTGAVNICRQSDPQLNSDFTSDILKEISGKGVTISPTTDPDYYTRFINSPKGNEYVILRSYKRNFEFKVREVVSDKTMWLQMVDSSGNLARLSILVHGNTGESSTINALPKFKAEYGSKLITQPSREQLRNVTYTGVSTGTIDYNFILVPHNL